MIRIDFPGKLLIIGCGSVSLCFQDLLLNYTDIEPSQVFTIDPRHPCQRQAEYIGRGVTFNKLSLTIDNYEKYLSENLKPGDALIDLAWNVDTADVVEWCQDNDVIYLNTSIEVWDPVTDFSAERPSDLIAERHHALRQRVKHWKKNGKTAVVEHGANPGLVGHFANFGIEYIARRMLEEGLAIGDKKTAIEKALENKDYARLAMETETHTLHVSERDTQVSLIPKMAGEFLNTWSPESFYHESSSFPETAWGTHEIATPPNGYHLPYGEGRHLCLLQPASKTWVRSWVPYSEILGMMVAHGETFTISERFTLKDEKGNRLFQPTVSFVYRPTQQALDSLQELIEKNGGKFRPPENARVMFSEVGDGNDDLGVLFMGHAFNAVWLGSALGIDNARRIAPHFNVTVLQVAASLLSAFRVAVMQPNMGVCVPGDLPHEEILKVTQFFLGEDLLVQTDWRPEKARPREKRDRSWLQFTSFLLQQKDSKTKVTA